MNIDWENVKAACKSHGLDARTSLLNSTAMRRLSGFGRDEDGASGLLSFYTTLMLLLLAGLGVDTMRHEMERTHLQATLDAAVLAGAGAPQGTNAEGIATIVEDYFAKNGMSQYLHEIDLDGDDADIVTSLNATRVYAEASMDIDTYLLQMTGVDSLAAAGAAQAEVATPKLEISLVLDLSTSMQGQDLLNMQGAAKSFVTTIINQADPGDAVISIIPFSFDVTPGRHIFEALTVNKTHDYSSCLMFDADDYLEPHIDPDRSYEQLIFTSRYYNSFDNLNFEWRSCYPDENMTILPYSISETAMHTYIDSLTALGNTSANIGMKWGAAMLDDEFQDVVTHLQSDGVDLVDDSLSNLPAIYGENETLKVIVLMADGVNSDSLYFNPNGNWVGADSHLYRLDFEEEQFDYAYNAYNSSQRWEESWVTPYCDAPGYEWFICVYENVEWSNYYLRNGDTSDNFYDINQGVWRDISYLNSLLGTPESDGWERLSWEEAWGKMSPRQYAHITGNWTPNNEYVLNYNEVGTTKDTRLQNICTTTKSEGVVVYTIGYSITPEGHAETQLKTCASSENHYYPTNGSNITAAFNSIASNVKNLRLTQ